jgi:hypothetical protein
VAFRRVCIALGFFCLVLFIIQSPAASIDMLSSFGGSSVDSFGDVAGNNPGGTTFGQTFVIHGSDAAAQNLTFMVRPYYPTTAPQQITFQAFIMAWSGSRPTGSVLFASSPLTTTGSTFAWETFSLPLGGALLQRDQNYVAFFTADNFLDGIRSDAGMAINGNVYSEGTFVSHYGESGFNSLLTSDWSAPFGSSYDLAIKLDYQAVPEPSSALILLFGLGALPVWRRLKKQR